MSSQLRWLVVGALSAGCGTDPPSWQIDAGACVGYVVPPTTDLMVPTVSFRMDVMKVFGNRCASTLCHGNPDAPPSGLFLGRPEAMGDDASEVHAGLFEVESREHPGMKVVAMGDAIRSYLIHKVDGDQCLYDTFCVDGDCQRSMPSEGSVMNEEMRDVLRRWVVQGAADN